MPEIPAGPRKPTNIELLTMLAKIWSMVKSDEDSEYDTNNLYSYVREGVEAKKRLVEGERAIKDFVAGRTEEALVEFDATVTAVNAAVERCAQFAEEFDDFVYEGRKVDGYSKGTYMMVDGRATMKAVAAKIRSGE